MTAQRYSRTAIFLHWTIALALAFQLALGWRLEETPKGPELFAGFQLHKSVGLTILVLTLVRIAIRVMRPHPELMADSLWAKRLAQAVHWLFYGVLLLGPLSGWILVSTAKIKVPTLIFGVIPWPHLPVSRAWHEPVEGLHGFIATTGLLLFILHVVGALRHQFMKDENILGRMVPFLGVAPISKVRAAVAVAVVLSAIWLAHGAGWQIPFPAAPVQTAPAVIEANPGMAAPKAPAVEMEEHEHEHGAMVQEAPLPLSEWRVAQGGRLAFTALWTGTPINGSFTRWDSAIRFTPDAPEKTAIRVSVDLASASTADSQRDETLKGEDFFNVASNPRAVFAANGIRALGNDRYEARGTLDLHGTRRPVALAFTLRIKDDTARVSGSTRLDRTAFGVGSGEWAATDQIAANVSVSFAFTAKRKSAT